MCYAIFLAGALQPYARYVSFVTMTEKKEDNPTNIAKHDSSRNIRQFDVAAMESFMGHVINKTAKDYRSRAASCIIRFRKNINHCLKERCQNCGIFSCVNMINDKNDVAGRHCFP